MGISSGRMRLFYIDAEMREVVGREEMRFPQKQLYSYNMQDGDEIHVEERQKQCPVQMSNSTTITSNNGRSGCGRNSAMSSSI